EGIDFGAQGHDRKASRSVTRCLADAMASVTSDRAAEENATKTTAQIQSINPATEEVLASFPPATPDEIEAALRAGDAAFRTGRAQEFAERGTLMRRAGSYLRQHRARLGGIVTAEMGKPIVEAEAEIDKCAWNCEFYAENAERFLADEAHPSNASESYVQF